MTFEKYESSGQGSDPKVYYSRAKYNYRDGKIQPPPDLWRRYCICNKPMNPDYHYIFCESCQNWFHLACVKIQREEADNMGDYHCKKCLAKERKNLIQKNG